MKSEIKFNIKVKTWRDKATKAYIIYSKKYDISAYGETKRKAETMFGVILDEILKYSKPSNRKKAELVSAPMPQSVNTLNILLDNLIGSTAKEFNLYSEVKGKLDKKYHHLKFALVRLWVSNQESMPAEKELEELFPMHDFGDDTYDSWRKFAYNISVFQWEGLDMQLSELSGKKYLVPAGESAEFVFFFTRYPQ